MIGREAAGRAFSLALGLVLLATGATAQSAQKVAPAAAPAPVLEPRAVELLKAMTSKLAAARSMSFTAVTTYESPSVWGPALAFTTASEVLLQRPNKLAVLTAGDGPASEFYYDGKAMVQLAPAENLVAVASAPPTIDAMLKTLYDVAGTYFPFTDLIVADPYGDMTPLTLASYIGRSKVVGGTTTDMVAYESEGVFVQIWIGAEDKLPRLARAVFFDDPLQLRQQVQLSNWKLEPAVAKEAFRSSKAAGAIRIPFAHPKTQSKLPAAPRPRPTPKP